MSKAKRKRRAEGGGGSGTRKRKRSRFTDADKPSGAAASAPSAPPPSARWSASAAPPLPLDIMAIPVAPVSTLRINRDKAKEKARQKVAEATPAPPLLDTDPASNPYFDAALGGGEETRRAPRALRFVEEGAIAQRAEKLRRRAEDAALTASYRERIAERARQRVAVPELPPYVETRQWDAPTPAVEWWDAPFVDGEGEGGGGDGYERTLPDGRDELALNEGKVGVLVHQPQRLADAVPLKPPPVVPLMLTAKERKRVRRQRRSAELQEKQQMIAVGLLPTPPPKVKLSNMMRVLANETTADPTKIEMRVRAEVEARRARHEADNESRRRTKEQRAAQAAAKQEKDRGDGLRANVYRVGCAANAAHRFKVVMNARQLGLSGALLLFDDCNVVVVEGGEKACAKFRRLMLRRIDWTLLAPAGAEPSTEAKAWAKRGRANEAVLVWEGAVLRNAFQEFGTAECKSEAAARAFFKKKRVEHYWDLCIQQSPAGDTMLGARAVE